MEIKEKNKLIDELFDISNNLEKALTTSREIIDYFCLRDINDAESTALICYNYNLKRPYAGITNDYIFMVMEQINILISQLEQEVTNEISSKDILPAIENNQKFLN